LNSMCSLLNSLELSRLYFSVALQLFLLHDPNSHQGILCVCVCVCVLLSFVSWNNTPTGGTYASPILSLPEVAIGAIGKIQVLPRFDENGYVIRTHMINFSWSAGKCFVDVGCCVCVLFCSFAL
jgi:2-oxoacid dehydrogenases acyltransferase (catalytic domain)